MNEQKGIPKRMNYYNKKLKEGLKYQDFCSDILYKIGLPIFNYSSKEYQMNHGENKLGIEIKNDNNIEIYGNIFIETQERSNKERPYVKSGIYRNDNTWLYVIGNYKEIFIFSKKFLKQLFECGKYKEIENKRETGKGFLLSYTDAEKYCARHIIISEILNLE